jgi:hypothetical protein
MQLIVGTLMLYISMNVQKLLDDVGSSRFLWSFTHPTRTAR